MTVRMVVPVLAASATMRAVRKSSSSTTATAPGGTDASAFVQSSTVSLTIRTSQSGNAECFNR